jgi:hypothetical protein
MCKGKWLVKNSELLNQDVKAIYAEHNQQAHQLIRGL